MLIFRKILGMSMTSFWCFFIVKFEHISHFLLVFLLLIVNKWILAGKLIYFRILQSTQLYHFKVRRCLIPTVMYAREANLIYRPQTFFFIFCKNDATRPAFSCSKSTMEAAEQCVKHIALVFPFLSMNK